MLDFPSPATTGQVYTAAGASWRFDGTKWTETSGALSLPDAASDGNTYGRKNAAWNSVDAMIAPVSATANAALNDSGRSLLQNGLFNIQQRGVGPWTTNGAYTADRWIVILTSDTVSFGIAAIADAGRAAIGDENAAWFFNNTFTGNAAAGAFNFVEQRIENVRRTANKTVTVSFWATAGTAGLKLGVGGYQFFGTGGSPSAGVTLNGVAVTLSTAWTRYSVTLSIPSTSGKTLGTTSGTDYFSLRLFYSAGATAAAGAGNIGVQSGTITLWGVQLEYGSVATPLDYGGSPQQQLAACQRFFESFGIASDYTPATGYTGLYRAYRFAVTKRAQPTVTATNFTYYSNGTNTGFTPTTGGVGTDMLTIIGTGLTNAQGFISGTITASADL